MRLGLFAIFITSLVMPGLVLTKPAKRADLQTQQSTASTSTDSDQIIRSFSNQETEFAKALRQYRFKRDALVQSMGQGGQITGEYRRTSEISFDSSGKPVEKILFFPTPTLRAVGVATDDLDTLFGVQFFALEASKSALYNFKYAGKERIDELDLHAFDVTPKSTPDQKSTNRLFQGRIWVDNEGHQIVKLKGKGLPEPKYNPYPIVEVFREEIDGRYWFPTYVYADEELVLANGQAVKVRLKITYTEFKKIR